MAAANSGSVGKGKPMIKKKSNKKITLNEFRAWLSGIEDVLPAGWIPDAEQWETIRHKISLIEENVTPNFSGGVASQQVIERPAQIPPQINPYYAIQPEPLMPQVVIPGDVQQRLQEMRKTGTIMPTDGSTIKTPSVDSSDGTFKSMFE